ncbi:MAG TPA: HEAT repeat domain-containing protein [Terriglobales bacterium]|nr:HEAT repeat domain-containing protein [Terriglobales bacterium]
MGFISRLLIELGPAALVVKAILFSLAGIFLLIAFIVLRRWYRGRYFEELNQRTYAIRAQWDDIVSGRLPAKSWRLKKVDCSIVESILLDSIEVATPEQLPQFLKPLRDSGLLDMRILEARRRSGWTQRAALVALGRTRTPEAVPGLAEALDSSSQETRIAAVRGLGRTGVIEAAVPLLDRYVAGQLKVPEQVLKNALAACCRPNPSVLLGYMDQCSGSTRELLARVLGELAGPELLDELLILTADKLPEVRASAARALGNAKSPVALAALSALAADPEWFVRLRAVVALGTLEHPGKLKPLLRALCDSNRNVRQRAGWALARIEPELDHILEKVIETNDKYALQAFISELERSGAVEKVVALLESQQGSGPAKALLLEALSDGKKRLEKTALANSAAAGGH